MQIQYLFVLFASIIIACVARGEYDYEYCGGWGLLPGCECEEKMDAWNGCETCNFEGGYYGTAPDCNPCWRSPGMAGDYCETANSNTKGSVPGDAGCERICRNKFEGARCEICPLTVQLVDAMNRTCETCVAGHAETSVQAITSQFAPLCTSADCSGNETASGTRASGCTCPPHFNASAGCATCSGYCLSVYERELLKLCCGLWCCAGVRASVHGLGLL